MLAALDDVADGLELRSRRGFTPFKHEHFRRDKRDSSRFHASQRGIVIGLVAGPNRIDGDDDFPSLALDVEHRLQDAYMSFDPANH